jgi:glycosyltransferase involved in cell wall biosynthesis
LSDSRLLALSFAYPPAMAAMSVVVWRLLRHCGRRFCVIAGEDWREPDPGLAGIAALGAEEVRMVPFREKPLHLLARRILYRTPFSQLLQIPDIYRPWAAPAADALGDLHPTGHDILVTFASPMSTHLAGLRVRRRLPGIRWAAYFGDPWVTNPMFRRTGPARAMHARMERAVVGSADLLVFPCSEMRDLTLRGYGGDARARSRVIAHGFEEKLFPPAEPRQSGEPFIIRHLGSLYGSRTPSDLVSALDLIRHGEPAILDKLRFEFYGPHSDDFEDPGLPPGMVSFHPPVPYLESLGLMRSADALLVITPSEAESGAFLPSKIIDYIGAGRPVIGICRPGACSALVRDLGGWVTETGSPRSVADGLISLAAFLESARGGLHPWGDPPVRNGYSADRTGAVFGGFLSELS